MVSADLGHGTRFARSHANPDHNLERPVRAYVGVFLRGGIWVYAIAALMFAAPSTRTLETVLVFWAAGGVLSIAFSAISLSDLPWRELKGYNPDWNLILQVFELPVRSC